MKKLIVVFIFILYLVPVDVKGLSISGRSVIMIDNNSKRILYQKDIHSKRLIASTTKIMTAIITLENSNLNDIVTVGEEVLSMYGTNIYVELNEKMSVRDLLYGLMLRSGNDAAVVLAKYVGGSIENFVKMMNEKAKEIGMINTIFSNPHGLDEETQNYSTAYDMALLSMYASNNSLYNEITSTKKYVVQTNNKSYLWYNRNKLVGNYKFLTSGKTGYTPDAGKTFVSTAIKDNFSLTVVTLNDGNIYTTAQELYEYGFNNYKNYLILDKNNFKIDKGFYKDKIYIKNSFSYPLTETEVDDIRVLVKLIEDFNYEDGSEVGEVSVLLNDKEIYNDKVYIKKEKKECLFKRIWSWLFD